jgi:hypothetical protein
MAISVVDRKLLWGRSRNRCAYPGCSQELTVNLDDPESKVLGDAGAVLGEEAHIRSGSQDGPRHDQAYPKEKVDSYTNLILLCPTHHALIDKDGGKGFSVRQLEKMRSSHESAMQKTETAEAHAHRELSERMAAAIQVWETKIGIEHWQGLTGGLNYPTPILHEDPRDRLFQTGAWLLAKDWPDQFPRIREAFLRFADVLHLMLEHVSKNFEPDEGRSSWELEQTHKRIPWDPPLYEQLIAKYRLECAVTWFLTVELTRSANWIIAAIRSELDPLYRFDEGVLLMREGDLLIRNQIIRVEYTKHRWGEEFPALDLASIKDQILALAEREEVSEDAVNPYVLHDL